MKDIDDLLFMIEDRIPKPLKGDRGSPGKDGVSIKGDKGDPLTIVHGIGEPGNIKGDLYIDDETGDLWLNT